MVMTLVTGIYFKLPVAIKGKHSVVQGCQTSFLLATMKHNKAARVCTLTTTARLLLAERYHRSTCSSLVSTFRQQPHVHSELHSEVLITAE
jgi:hypothetical protein